jgi:transposase
MANRPSSITRVVDDSRARSIPFDELRRIGIDEISYRRGHKYLTAVVIHDSGRLVWTAVVGTRQPSKRSSNCSVTSGRP